MHLDVEEASKGYIQYLRVITYALAPEVMMVRALHQYLQARAGLKAYQDNVKDTRPFIVRFIFLPIRVTWSVFRPLLVRARILDKGLEENATMVQAFYILMGGIEIDSDDVEDSDARNFYYVLCLANARCINLPTTQEIMDKSKSDKFSKALAALQITWFLLRCIARRKQGLAITLLELQTVAYVFFGLFTLALCWHKPRDVETVTRLELLKEIPSNLRGDRWLL